MVSRKKSIAAVGGVLAALALTACAPKSADQAGGYGTSDTPALANATADPSASASAPTTDPSQNNVAATGVDTTELKVVNINKMGKAVVDARGFVLYRFDNDKVNPSVSNCNDDCAKVWPPATSNGTPQLNGVDASLVGTVTRQDGTTQITLAGWPLYFYIGDKKAGAWTGQNVGAKWFVVAADGKKNLSCLPTPPPKAVAPPADNTASNNNEGSGGY